MRDFDPSQGEIAHGYQVDIDGSTVHGSQVWGCGGIISSVHELSIFIRALVNGELFQNESTFQLMSDTFPGSNCGLGIFSSYNGKYGRFHYHTGRYWGYDAFMIYNEKKDAVICACRTVSGEYDTQQSFYGSVVYPYLDLLPEPD